MYSVRRCEVVRRRTMVAKVGGLRSVHPISSPPPLLWDRRQWTLRAWHDVARCRRTARCMREKAPALVQRRLDAASLWSSELRGATQVGRYWRGHTPGLGDPTQPPEPPPH
jgi:hypothetical protein